MTAKLTAKAGALLGACLLVGPPVFGDDAWVALSGPEIEAALDARKLVYRDASQTFYKSGRTLYDAGRPSWGYWRVQGDMYCSQWPPNTGWECYGFERHVPTQEGGPDVRFISPSGYVTEGTYVE